MAEYREGGTATETEAKWTPGHWITRDPEHILFMDNADDVQLYAVACDPEHENVYGQLTPEHYHVMFAVKQRPKNDEKKMLFRRLRRRFGCKPNEHPTGSQAQKAAQKCKDGRSGSYCPQCEFFIKSAKPIQSPVHARNIFRYISSKEGAVYTQDTDFGHIEEEYDPTADYLNEPFIVPTDYSRDGSESESEG